MELNGKINLKRVLTNAEIADKIVSVVKKTAGNQLVVSKGYQKVIDSNRLI